MWRFGQFGAAVRHLAAWRSRTGRSYTKRAVPLKTVLYKKTNKAIPASVFYLAIYERQANGRYYLRYWVETGTPKSVK